MKRLLMNEIANMLRLSFSSSRKAILLLFFPLFLTGIQAGAQSPLPEVWVQFANPQFDCYSHNYSVDVELKSNVSGREVFGMNVRFFYDDHVLEYLNMYDFEGGYAGSGSPQRITNPLGTGNYFGLEGSTEWINGYVEKTSPGSPVYLSTTSWTKLFSIAFHIDDPHSLDIYNFCPSIIWDLEANAASGGYLAGDKGVAVTLVDPELRQDSELSCENAVQFNWAYGGSGDLYGHPVKTQCVSTSCGYAIPLSNWSLFLAIGLMLVVSVFIYRRKISGYRG